MEKEDVVTILMGGDYGADMAWAYTFEPFSFARQVKQEEEDDGAADVMGHGGPRHGA